MKNLKMICTGFLVFYGVFCMSVLHAQQKKLTYKQAYLRAEPRLLEELPQIEGWMDGNHYVEQRTAESAGRRITEYIRIHAESGDETVLLDEGDFIEILPPGISLNRHEDMTDDYQKVLFKKEGDLYCLLAGSKSFKRLTATAAEEMNPRFSPDRQWIAYTRNHNLYSLDIETGLEHQLTGDGSDVIYNGWSSWVYHEEILGRRSRHKAFWWSPDSRMIAFLRFDDSSVPEFPLYRADGVHGELEITRYPKPGDPNPKVRLGIVLIPSGEIVWTDLEEQTDDYVAWPMWTPDSRQLFFQWMNRDQDLIKIYSADPLTGKTSEVHEEYQTTWVEFYRDLTFLEDGSGFLLRSGVEGWTHLYYYNIEGNVTRLTGGEWSARDIVRVDAENKKVYFHGSVDNSTENHLYQVDLNGKRLSRMTGTPGWHTCNVSPDGKYYIDRYSNIHHPQKLELYSSGGDLLRIIGDEENPFLKEYTLGTSELFTIPSGDGYNLPAQWILPPDFDSSKQYPVLFSIYGGPGAASVRNRFNLSRHFLAQNGIIVLTVDHRGAGHFGKRAVDLMHRNLGKWEMHDYIAAVQWLYEKSFVDPGRIGITGGSYGGYATCMALTCGADYFTHGIAQYSVTDWRLYDNVYTERYMDTPAVNPEGYEFGSVMTHADKYKGKLLITHGTLDDNVHMQNTIQLIDKLQDLDKDFELMLYPNERHGIRNPKRDHSVRESLSFWFRHFFNRDIPND